MAQHDSGTNKVVSHDEWLAARTEFLAKEKDFTRLVDAHNRERRELPWELVTKPYAFDTIAGRKALSDLFDGRSQLIIYHFMFTPDDKAGCPHCSLRADGFDGIGPHLNARDVTIAVVSSAPLAKITEYKNRMGWRFNWVSSAPSDFNRDYFVSFTPEERAAKKAYYNYTIMDPGPPEREGHSVFFRDADGAVYHTYSCYARGNDKLNIHYHYLDMVPRGRDEGGRGPYWVRRRDEY